METDATLLCEVSVKDEAASDDEEMAVRIGKRAALAAHAGLTHSPASIIPFTVLSCSEKDENQNDEEIADKKICRVVHDGQTLNTEWSHSMQEEQAAQSCIGGACIDHTSTFMKEKDPRNKTESSTSAEVCLYFESNILKYVISFSKNYEPIFRINVNY